MAKYRVVGSDSFGGGGPHSLPGDTPVIVLLLDEWLELVEIAPAHYLSTELTNRLHSIIAKVEAENK